MTQRPTFQAQLDATTRRGATSLHGERSVEQRVAELERSASIAASYSPFLLFQWSGYRLGSSSSSLRALRTYDQAISATANVVTAGMFGYDSSVYAVGGLQMQWRIVASLGCNATAPGANIAFSIRDWASLTGAANTLTVTPNAVTGLDVTFTAPSAGSENTDASDWVDAPSNGVYGAGIFNSATTAANSAMNFSVRLEGRYVTSS